MRVVMSSGAVCTGGGVASSADAKDSTASVLWVDGSVKVYSKVGDKVVELVDWCKSY